VGVSKTFTISDNFKKRADSAAFFEAWAATKLTRLGLFVNMGPFTIWKPGEDIEPYLKAVDLVVWTTDSSHGTPVEVKSQNLSFSNVSDYPMERPLVCSQASWVRKTVPPSSVTVTDQLYVSRVTGEALWLPSGSPVELGVRVFDKDRNESYLAVSTWKRHMRPLTDFASSVKR